MGRNRISLAEAVGGIPMPSLDPPYYHVVEAVVIHTTHTQGLEVIHAVDSSMKEN